tara:strand:- start:7604 stop:8137 length:534 start_codon:yes stop_codon:yes gene_type:complete
MARLKLVDFLIEAPKTSNIVIDNDDPSKVKAKKDAWSSGKNIHHDLDHASHQEKSDYDYVDLEDIEAREDAWGGGENLVNKIDYRKVQKMLEACGCEDKNISDDYGKMREEGPYWHGPGCESAVPDMDSYRSVGDILIRNPGLISVMLEPLLDAAGADCPVSAAMALSHVADLYGRG